MSNTALSLKLREIRKAREDLAEALKIVEIARILFQKKLAALGEELKRTREKDKAEEITQEAEKLYQEYKQTLQVIENYMDQTYQKVI